MCLAKPVQIKSKISDHCFKVDGGKIIDTSLCPDIKIGDWILCHADLAINKVDESEAQDILNLANQHSH